MQLILRLIYTEGIVSRIKPLVAGDLITGLIIVCCGEKVVRLGKETYGLDLFCIENYCSTRDVQELSHSRGKSCGGCKKRERSSSRKLPKGIDPLQPFLS